MSRESRLPRVSVIIPSFNPGAFLEYALRSALEQTYEEVEVVVVDDGSTDGCDYARICAADQRVRYLSQRNGGPAVARNTGILAASGDYVAFLDADDLWDPTKLARQVALMEDNPEAPLCYTDYSRGEDTNPRESMLARYRPRQPGRTFTDLLQENFVFTSSVVIRRSALARAGVFDPDLRGPEDYDLWLRLARTGEFVFVDEILAHKRDHAGNLSRSLGCRRDLRKLFRLVRGRWGQDPSVRALIRRRLGEYCQDLAHVERSHGNLSNSRQAYLESARLGTDPLRSLFMAGLLCLPSPAFRCIEKLARSVKQPG